MRSIAICSGLTFLPDFWAWDIDPKCGGAGWTRHRDRGRGSLRGRIAHFAHHLDRDQ